MRYVVLSSIALVASSFASAAEPVRAGPDWWSLQPISRPIPPITTLPLETNPIDAFIRAKLVAAGLKPAPTADRRTLIRRVTFDLTGLPPRPADIDSFVADNSPDAYEKLIDSLLASSAYGERWARHWLDLVRFSESHGFEYDRLRDNAWPYRDYVIRSLNSDKPYADFVREQIAGDALPTATRDGVIATGMLVAGPFDQAGMSSVSASVRGKAREDELEDMLGTVAQTFLGVTLNCARCHDHKFDPYTARDYYRLKAVFEGVRPGERAVDPPADAKAREAAIDRLDRELEQLQARIRDIEERTRKKTMNGRDGPTQSDTAPPRPIARWTFDVDGRDSIGQLHAELKDGAKIAGGRLVVDGERAFAITPPLTRDLSTKTLEAWVSLPTLKQGGGGVIGVQVLNGSQFDSIVFAEQKPLRWMPGSEGFVRTRDVGGTDETSKPGEFAHIAITYAANGRIALYRNGRPYGESFIPERVSRPAKFAAKEAHVIFGMRHSGGANAFLRGEIDEARLYDSPLTAEQVHASFKAGVSGVLPHDLQRAMSENDRQAHAADTGNAARIEAELAALRNPPLTYGANPKKPGQTFLLRRGDIEKPGELVSAGSPAVVKGPPAVDLPESAAESERRRAFADWVIHPNNPLTWRVIVNRVWQHHFGDGLVRTPNDFGLNGEKPTHPELLDWLSSTLRDNGGSLKALHRLIVTSATYRQSSVFDAKAAEFDADNRLLWRYSPRRLEAEAVRDAMLAASGKLNRHAGGPSARPFRIETFNSAFYVLFDEDSPAFNRRSVYRMNVNSAKDPVLDVLDCPDPSVKSPRRNATTTPLQALTMMNNPFVDRMARSFAERIAREAGDRPEKQLVFAYRIAIGREPTQAEQDRAVRVVRESGLKAVCWALLNASEFVYVK